MGGQEGRWEGRIQPSGNMILGRIQIKMWAVVRIQRCFKRFLKRKQKHQQAKQKVRSS